MKSWLTTVTVGLVALVLFSAVTGSARADTFYVDMTFEAGVGNVFDPAEITVSPGNPCCCVPGDVVVFTSTVGVHTTTSIDGDWDSGFVSPGNSFQVDFTGAALGDYFYICTLHFDCCNMAGVIHVVQPGCPPCCPPCPSAGVED